MSQMSDLHIEMVSDLGENASAEDIDIWLHLYLLEQRRKKNDKQAKAFLDSHKEAPIPYSEKNNERDSKSD